MKFSEEQEQSFIEQIEDWLSAYQVTGCIGDGGFGKVYRVENLQRKNRASAVKLVYVDNNPSLENKIEREIENQYYYGDVPEVVKLEADHKIALGDGKTLYMIKQELMDGSIADILKEKARYTEKDAVKIVMDVCDVLITMQDYGMNGAPVIHGDIKPANILYKHQKHNGEVIYKLSDFGCAFDTDQTQTSWAGTLGYALPGDWSPTRDEYALAVTLMEMLGVKPPRQDEMYDKNGLWNTLPAKIVSDQLLAICQKATAVFKEDRYQTAEEMKAALKDWLKETEAAEKIRQEKFDRALRLLAELKGVYPGKMGENAQNLYGEANITTDTMANISYNPEVMNSMRSEAETLLSELLEDAAGEEDQKLKTMLQDCLIYKEQIITLSAYHKAENLTKTGNYHDLLEAIRIFAGIHEFEDAAEQITLAAQNAELAGEKMEATWKQSVETMESNCKESLKNLNQQKEALQDAHTLEIDNLSQLYADKIQTLEKENETLLEQLKNLETINQSMLEEKKKAQEEQMRLAEEARRKAAAMEHLKPGCSYEFGHLNVNDNLTPIRWRILENNGSQMLLLSEEALDAKAFDRTNLYAIWENSEIKHWLNNNFYADAFSREEQEKIVNPFIADPLNNFDMAQKANEDKVFLLSLQEVEKYIPDPEQRKCRTGGFAREHGAYVTPEGSCWWWLRTKGGTSSRAMCVTIKGETETFGYFLNNNKGAVRPAIWVKI